MFAIQLDEHYMDGANDTIPKLENKNISAMEYAKCEIALANIKPIHCECQCHGILLENWKWFTIAQMPNHFTWKFGTFAKMAMKS